MLHIKPCPGRLVVQNLFYGLRLCSKILAQKDFVILNKQKIYLKFGTPVHLQESQLLPS